MSVVGLSILLIYHLHAVSRHLRLLEPLHTPRKQVELCGVRFATGDFLPDLQARGSWTYRQRSTAGDTAYFAHLQLLRVIDQRRD